MDRGQAVSRYDTVRKFDFVSYRAPPSDSVFLFFLSGVECFWVINVENLHDTLLRMAKITKVN